MQVLELQNIMQCFPYLLPSVFYTREEIKGQVENRYPGIGREQVSREYLKPQYQVQDRAEFKDLKSSMQQEFDNLTILRMNMRGRFKKYKF